MSELHEQLILKFFAGTVTPEEQQALDAWMQESEENKKLVNDFSLMWQAGNHKIEEPDFDKTAEWKKLEAAITREPKKAKEVKFYSYSTALRVAASVGVIMVFSWVLYIVVFSHETILKESGDVTMQISLPDGTEVWLNRNSKIAYHDNFNKTDRTVILTGEAFFEVKPDTSKPFIVQTTQARVKVLGTSFNVQAYEASAATEVFVVTGLVNFCNIREEKGINLKPGEMAVTNSNTVVVLNDDHSNTLAWREKRLTFKKTSLNTVVENLEHYFKINIEIKNQNIVQCRFTGSFDQPTIEEIIEALSVSLDLTIVKKDDIYVIDGDGC
jgi:transmembrane sensor